jgi:hypothetical protein
VDSSHFPPFVAGPSTFLWGRHWLIRLNPYCDSARLESKWHYKGVLKGFSYAIDQRPPFVLTENSPTLWPVQTTLVCFHLVFLSLLEPGSDAATLGCPPRAPVCCREVLCRRCLDDRRAKTGTSSVYLGAPLRASAGNP